MPKTDDIQTLPDLAIGLYDRLTGRDAEISYNFDNFESTSLMEMSIEQVRTCG